MVNLLKTYKYLIVILMLCSCISCKFLEENPGFTPDESIMKWISLKNVSDKNIYVFGWMMRPANSTISAAWAFAGPAGKTKLIAPNESYDELYTVVMDGFERTVTYEFIIFDEKTVESYSKEELIENNIYDKIYIFTYEELVENEFTIIYTGEMDE